MFTQVEGEGSNSIAAAMLGQLQKSSDNEVALQAQEKLARSVIGIAYGGK